MAIDERRRADIAAALDAYARANPDTPLPRNTARLLAVLQRGLSPQFAGPRG